MARETAGSNRGNDRAGRTPGLAEELRSSGSKFQKSKEVSEAAKPHPRVLERVVSFLARVLELAIAYKAGITGRCQNMHRLGRESELLATQKLLGSCGRAKRAKCDSLATQTLQIVLGLVRPQTPSYTRLQERQSLAVSKAHRGRAAYDQLCLTSIALSDDRFFWPSNEHSSTPIG